MKIEKIGVFLLSVCLAFAMMGFSAFAREDDLEASIPEDEWEGFRDSLPSDVTDRLPDGALDTSGGLAESVAEMSTGEYIVSVVLDVLGVGLFEAAKLFLALLCVLALSAVMGTVSVGLESQGLSGAMRFCSSAALMSVVVYTLYSHFSLLEDFFGKLWTMVGAMIPVTSSIWAMGGNVSTAATGSAWFYVMITVCQTLMSGTVIPVCCVLSVLGLCDSFSEEVKVGRIMSAIKKIYNFLLGFVMTVLLASLAAQTSLSASADTVAARSARLMSGTLIPVVGGSVGETFRTLAGGVSYLKNIFGIGGIIMIALLVVPVLLTVLLTRFVFMLAGGVADMIGCSNEARLLENLGDVYGTMLGVVACVSVIFILGLCMFIQTVVAVA